MNNPRFELKDQANWPRRHIFEHYANNVVCTSSRTVNIEIGKLLEACKASDVKLYPAMIYIIATAVNSIDELKIDRDTAGEVGAWNFLFSQRHKNLFQYLDGIRPRF